MTVVSNLVNLTEQLAFLTSSASLDPATRTYAASRLGGRDRNAQRFSHVTQALNAWMASALGLFLASVKNAVSFKDVSKDYSVECKVSVQFL